MHEIERRREKGEKKEKGTRAKAEKEYTKEKNKDGLL